MSPPDRVERALRDVFVGDPLAPPSRHEVSQLVRQVVVPMRADSIVIANELSKHQNEETEWRKTQEKWQEKIDQALFDPLDGLVNVRRWLTRIGGWIMGVVAFAVMLGPFVRAMGWV